MTRFYMLNKLEHMKINMYFITCFHDLGCTLNFYSMLSEITHSFTQQQLIRHLIIFYSTCTYRKNMQYLFSLFLLKNAHIQCIAFFLWEESWLLSNLFRLTLLCIVITTKLKIIFTALYIHNLLIIFVFIACIRIDIW